MFSFRKAIKQVDKANFPQVQKDILAILNCTSRTAFYRYRNGETKLRCDEYVAITEYFNAMGITDIWD